MEQGLAPEIPGFIALEEAGEAIPTTIT